MAGMTEDDYLALLQGGRKQMPGFTGRNLGTVGSTGRPIMENDDGTVSTERSITVTNPDLNGGAPTNIPSMWGGKVLDDDAAVGEALKTGKKWQAYPSIDEAVKAAEAHSADLGTELDAQGVRAAPPSGGGMKEEDYLALLKPKAPIEPPPAAPAAMAAPPPAPPDVGAMPEIGMASTAKGFLDIPGQFRDLKMAGKSLLSNDPEELAKLLGNTPGVQVKRGQGNVPYANVGGKDYSFNTPGLSRQDVLPFAAATGAQMLASRVMPGAMPMIAREGLAGAVAGAGMEGARAAGGLDTTVADVGRGLVTGGIGGALGALVSTAAGSLMRKYGSGILDKAGKLTKTALAAFTEAKIDPGNLHPEVLAQMDTALKGAQVTAPTVAATSRQAIADRAGVPLTMGQATRDTARLQAENEMLSGARGGKAQALMEQQAQTASDQFGQAVTNVEGRAAPGAVLGGTEADAGEGLREAIRARHAERRGEIGGMYKEAFQTMREHELTMPAPTGLMDNIGKTWAKEAAGIDEKTAPTAAGIMQVIRNLSEEQFTTPERVVQIRRNITGNMQRLRGNPNSAQDLHGLGIILKELDSWNDDTLNSISHTVAGRAANDMRKAADQQYRDYAQTFRPQRVDDQGVKMNDRGGKFMEAARGSEATGQELFNTLAGGSSQISSSGQRIAERVQRALEPGPARPAAPTVSMGRPGSMDEAGQELVPFSGQGSGQELALLDPSQGRRVGSIAPPGPIAETTPATEQLGSALDTARAQIIRRVVRGTADKQATGELPGYTSVKNRVAGAMTGQSRDTIRALLGDRGRSALGELGDLAAILETPKVATNPSHSGDRGIAYMRKKGAEHIGGAVGAAAGGVGGYLFGGYGAAAGIAAGGYIGREAAPYIADKLGARAARRALMRFEPPPGYTATMLNRTGSMAPGLFAGFSSEATARRGNR